MAVQLGLTREWLFTALADYAAAVGLPNVLRSNMFPVRDSINICAGNDKIDCANSRDGLPELGESVKVCH